VTLTNTEAVTDLSILESLDFESEEVCEWCECQGLPEQPAAFYLKRPACPCHPNGRVFTACREWKVRHGWGWGIRASCCGAIYDHEEVVVVGEVR
jgi:hypothetical protein